MKTKKKAVIWDKYRVKVKRVTTKGIVSHYLISMGKNYARLTTEQYDEFVSKIALWS